MYESAGGILKERPPWKKHLNWFCISCCQEFNRLLGLVGKRNALSQPIFGEYATSECYATIIAESKEQLRGAPDL